jgi:phosphatidylinositol alpha-1,6-mannosyltransferase
MPPLEVPPFLLVTNDFPPRIGGVQQYEWNMLRPFPPERVSVLAPAWPGWREHDAEQHFAVTRWPGGFLWPTAELATKVRAMARDHGAEVVVLGQGLPLSLLAPRLAAAGLPSVVLTHGVELWMARLPGSNALLRRGLAGARAVTAVSEYTARAVRRAAPPGLRVVLVSPGVDEGRFASGIGAEGVRASLGVGDRPMVLCVSRLVTRKGQDVLIRSMDVVRTLVPDAVLVVVGDGPDAGRLRDLARTAPAGSVVFAGAVPDDELPAHYGACDVFAMPCRSRWGGLEVEGFGIVFLEAAAAGRAVVAGRSGGAAEAVVDGETGLLVEGREPKAVALAVARLLLDPALRGRMGAAGRARVEARFTWTGQSERLAEVLRESVASSP